MEENCYTKDILYSSDLKNAWQIAMRYRETYSLQKQKFPRGMKNV